MVNVVIDPVGIEKVGMRFPGDQNIVAGVVVPKIVQGDLGVQALGEIAFIFFLQGVRIIFPVTKHENLPSVHRLNQINASLVRFRQQAQAVILADIGRMYLGVA